MPRNTTATVGDGLFCDKEIKLFQWLMLQLLHKSTGKLLPRRVDKLQALVDCGKLSWDLPQPEVSSRTGTGAAAMVVAGADTGVVRCDGSTTGRAAVSTASIGVKRTGNTPTGGSAIRVTKATNSSKDEGSAITGIRGEISSTSRNSEVLTQTSSNSGSSSSGSSSSGNAWQLQSSQHMQHSKAHLQSTINHNVLYTNGLQSLSQYGSSDSLTSSVTQQTYLPLMPDTQTSSSSNGALRCVGDSTVAEDVIYNSLESDVYSQQSLESIAQPPQQTIQTSFEYNTQTLYCPQPQELSQSYVPNIAYSSYNPAVSSDAQQHPLLIDAEVDFGYDLSYLCDDGTDDVSVLENSLEEV